MTQSKYGIYFLLCLINISSYSYAMLSSDEKLMDPMVPITLERQQLLLKQSRDKMDKIIYLSMIGTSIHNELYAVINDKILMIGDSINDYWISMIEKHKVTLLNKENKDEIILEM